jgi:hypothetical protein
MAKRAKKRTKPQTKSQEFVVVAFAEDLQQAKDYESLLKSNDIPAVIGEEQEDSMNRDGFAVMVPEAFLDEAHVVIESQDAYDDFYDLALEDDSDDDFESDFLDDNF